MPTYPIPNYLDLTRHNIAWSNLTKPNLNMSLTNNALRNMNNFISSFKALLAQKKVSPRQLLAVAFTGKSVPEFSSL